jgi:hypothetical protein
MNINLMTHNEELMGNMELIAKALVQHGELICGPAVLLPDEDVQGVFQVWWPTKALHGSDYGFAHVTPDGSLTRTDMLPAPEYFDDENGVKPNG